MLGRIIIVPLFGSFGEGFMLFIHIIIVISCILAAIAVWRDPSNEDKEQGIIIAGIVMILLLIFI